MVKQDPTTGKWILYTRDGKRQLGVHDTPGKAYGQEYAIIKSQEKKVSRKDVSPAVTKEATPKWMKMLPSLGAGTQKSLRSGMGVDAGWTRPLRQGIKDNLTSLTDRARVTMSKRDNWPMLNPEQRNSNVQSWVRNQMRVGGSGTRMNRMAHRSMLTDAENKAPGWLKWTSDAPVSSKPPSMHSVMEMGAPANAVATQSVVPGWMPWHTRGGVNIHEGNFNLSTNRARVAASIMNGRKVKPNARYSGYEGVLQHELGHQWQFNTPGASQFSSSKIMDRLHPTISKDNHDWVGNPGRTAGEAIAQWRATLGNSFGARAATRLPLINAQASNPASLELWKSQIPGFQRMSPKLQDRLLATRSHLASNYGVPNLHPSLTKTAFDFDPNYLENRQKRRDLETGGLLAGSALMADTARTGWRGIDLSDKLKNLSTRILTDPTKMLKAEHAIPYLREYGDTAGELSRLRIMGIPAGRILQTAPMSTLTRKGGIPDLLRAHMGGMGLEQGKLDSIRGQMDHYKGFLKDPQTTLLNEVFTGGATPNEKALFPATKRIGLNPGEQKLLMRGMPDPLGQLERMTKLRRGNGPNPQLDALVGRTSRYLFGGGATAKSIRNGTMDVAKARNFGPGGYAAGASVASKVMLPLGLLGSSLMGVAGTKRLFEDHVKIASKGGVVGRLASRGESPVKQLIKAKAHSDVRRYGPKHSILSKLIHERPGDFVSDGKGQHPGLTHTPSGFRIHAPKSVAARATGKKEEKKASFTTHLISMGAPEGYGANRAPDVVWNKKADDETPGFMNDVKSHFGNWWNGKVMQKPTMGEYGANAGLLAGGAALINRGMRYSPSNLITATAGRIAPPVFSMDVGAGHVTPAKAIHEALQQHPAVRSGEFQSDIALRAMDANAVSNYKGKGFGLGQLLNRKDNLSMQTPFALQNLAQHGNRNSLVTVDSGFGASAAHGAGGLWWRKPEFNVNPSGQVGFFPDSTNRIGNDLRVIMHGHPADVHKKMPLIGFGQPSKMDAKGFGRMAHFPVHPAIQDSVLNLAESRLDNAPPAKEVWAQTAANLRNKGFHGEADAIQNAIDKGKKMIAVTGSSRGDFVPQRINEITKALAKDPSLAERIQLIGLMGSQHGEGTAAKLMQGSGAIALPNTGKFFQDGSKGLFDMINASDAHYGSTGASAFAEANLSRTPSYFVTDYGSMRDRMLKGLQDSGHTMSPDELTALKSLDLDKWNNGTISEVKKGLRGLNSANTGEEFVNHLRGILDGSKPADRVSHAADYLRQAREGKAGLADELVNYARQVRKTTTGKMTRRLGAGGLMAALGGVGMYDAIKRDVASPMDMFKRRTNLV